MQPDLARAAERLVRDQMAVRPGEGVLITTDTAADASAAHAVFAAAGAAGAKPNLMVLPQLPFQGQLADPYISPGLAAAAAASDVWVDLTFPYFAGSHVHDRAMKNGRTRYFLGVDVGGPGLARLYGGVDLDRLYDAQDAFDALIAGATGAECRIASPAGTDVTFRLAPSAANKKRRLDAPGMIAVPGSCLISPEIDSVKGRIALDKVFHEYYAALPAPMTVHLDGRIRAVEGGGAERSVMERALRRAAGGGYGHVIHFTLGFHPAARYGHGFVEDIRVVGNNAVGFGTPWWLPGGGENHPDGVVTAQSLWVDGALIAERGAVVGPERAVAALAGLEPR
jgi:leucyl aminopeptidase (aminopeptidase T)